MSTSHEEAAERIVLGLAFSWLLGMIARNSDEPRGYLEEQGEALSDMIQAVHIATDNPATEVAIRNHGAAFGQALVNAAYLFAGLTSPGGDRVGFRMNVPPLQEGPTLSPEDLARILRRPREP